MRAALRNLSGFVFALTSMLPNAYAAYPDKPIKLVIASGPGGSLDITGRTYAQKLSGLLGQQVVVENKVGAGALPAIQYVLQQPADGYTLLLGSANVVMTPYLYPESEVAVMRALISIAPSASSAMFLSVPAELPVKNLTEFLAYAKACPGALNFGTASSGGFDVLAGKDFMLRAGIDLAVIPFKGEGAALLELLAGRTQAQMATWLTLAPHVKAGKVRVLAATTANRSPIAPDVPTIAEQGFPGYDAGAWSGMFARTGLPPDVVQKLSRAMYDAQQSIEIREKLADLGQVPFYLEPDQFRRMIGGEEERWGGLINKLGLKP